MATEGSTAGSTTSGEGQQQQQHRMNGGSSSGGSSSGGGGPTTYEQIMGKKGVAAAVAAAVSSGTAEGAGAGEMSSAKALSSRLGTFRRWLSEEAGVQLHPALCLVNGEATDGTRNAPVLLFEEKRTEGKSSKSSSVNAGRVGAIDWDGDQALYDRTMGCQVRAVREVKKDEVVMTTPRGAMITPDLVASSDAGRAILACCLRPPLSVDEMVSGEEDLGFWDAFENTTICENKYSAKHASNTSKQLLVKVLQERKRAETAFTKRGRERQQQSTVDGEPPQLKYTLPAFGTVSTRAPLLAFLIHQRFADIARPPVAADTDAAREQFERILAGDDGNSLRAAKAVSRPPVSPDTFAPYARTLPSSVSIPLCWKRSELALLASCIPGAGPLQEVAARTLQLVAEFTALLESGVLERFPETFPDGLITWERWVWAAAIVSSRALPATSYTDAGNRDAAEFQPTDPLEFQSPAHIWNELGVMVPLLDMLNHEIEAHQVTWQPCVPEKAVVAKAEASPSGEENGDSLEPEPHPPRAIVHKKVRKGSELFCCYGNLSNSILLSQYGFAQIANPTDEVRLGWGLMDSVGHLEAPKDYESPLKDDDSYRRFYVFETSDEEASKKWWTDDRFSLLEKEMSSREKDFSDRLKNGQKMTVCAYADGSFNPILLAALVIATMPKIELQKFVQTTKETLVLTRRHQQVLRNYLAFLFSRKLEKLLQNVSSGLKDHFGTVKLWPKVSNGGLRYKPEEGHENPEGCVGWQSFFDSHAYRSAMEVENHYYAMGTDSCVLALYDGQLKSLQLSLDAVCDDDKFQNIVLQQLEDLNFGVATEKSEGGSPAGGELSAGDNVSPGSDKKQSPRSRKRSKNKATVATGSGSSGNDNGDLISATKLHVGNLSFSTTPSDMYDYFCSLHGKDNILECHIPIERDTGRSRGFGFVTMPEALATRVLETGQKHEMGGRLVKLAKSNSAGTTSTSGKPRSGMVSSNDRCPSCGYRPKYCTCAARAGGDPHGPPGPVDPYGGRELDGRRDDRDYSYYGSDRHYDARYRDEPPPPPDYGYDRDAERDRYGRPYERDRYSSRHDEPPPPRHPDDRYYDRSHDRSRSSGWRGGERGHDEERRPSSRRGDEGYAESSRSRKRSRSRSGRSGERERSRSRERSRNKRRSKRRTRSHSRSSSSSPPRGA